MSRRLLMGLDVGGGSGRSLLVDIDTGAASSASRPWRFATAPGTAGLGADLDLDLIWSCLAEASREVLARANASASEVKGVAATSLRLGSVVLDREGAPLLAVPNRDARAAEPGLLMAMNHGDRIYSRMGRWPYPVFSAARLQWLAENDPTRMQRASHFLSISDWVTYKLCGAPVAEPSQAGESLLFDLTSREWAWDWIEELGLSRELFPAVQECGSQAGPLASGAAADLGLSPGTPVGVGGADTQCGLLGVAAVDPGDVAIIAGTTAPVQVVVPEPVIDPAQRLWSGHHVVPGRWILESNAGPVGELLEWLGRLLFPEAPEPVVRFLAEASLSTPGARGLLSTTGARVMNAKDMNLAMGALSLSHLTSDLDPAPRRHLLRAVVEGMACALRANLEQLRDAAGLPLGGMRLGGGLSRSGSFSQILADVLDAPIEVDASHQASALGAAMCAGVAAGIYPDLPTASRSLVELDKRVTPVPENAALSQTVYESWSQLHAAQEQANTTAANLFMPWYLGRAAADTRSAAPRHRPRVLVTADFDADSLGVLESLGEVEYASFREQKRMLSGTALVEALGGFDVFVTEVDLVDAASLEALPDLRVVFACRGDAVNVDVAACTAHGIPLLHAPGRNADAVADLTLTYLLMLSRRFPEAGEFLRQPGIEAGDMGRMGQAFSTLQGRELWHKTVGLVGLGAVGRGVARRLGAFGARVLVSDPFVSEEQAALVGARSVGLDELLSQSDFVSLHASVTPETSGMIGAAQLARMKPSACLINTARAALTHEEELVAALSKGTIAAAALDTFSVEPPGSDHPLFELTNVIATPHIGGNTREVSDHQGRIVVAELERLLDGEPAAHVLNRQVLPDFDWATPRPRPSAEQLEALRTAPAPAVSDLQKKPESPAEARPGAARAALEAAPGVPPELRERMEAILQSFVARIAGDEKLRDASLGKQVALHFTLTELGLEFHFVLADGEVMAELGAPPEPADVQLRMRSEILDGMFTGRGNPMEAAMQGRLSFTGDTGKAMALQELDGDLRRLYMAAREAVGDPGDLAALPDPGQSPGAPARPSPGGPGDLRQELVEIVRELYEAEVITATGGNVSARATDDDSLWITPSQLFKGDLSPEVLVPIDLDGQALDPGARSPSSEWSVHCAVYRAKPQAKAVIHAHAPNATILANAGLPFLPISTEAAFFGELPRVPFIMPGTRDLADAVGEAIGDGWAVLMTNHGIIVAGRSLRRAADMVEIIERSAQVIVGCYAVGKPPSVLPDEIIDTLRKMGDLIA
ncbi:MAG: class II aldolase/adducin family protein [Deltaproteobacteria bacterium]|nr:class II aldolase/adducin family protein [Deltaproteobacteria bacterium]